MTLETQKAVFFTDPDALLAWKGPCDRLYFGHEFCQRRLPSPEALRRAAAHARAAGRGFTFVTPFVTDAGLTAVQALVRELLADGPAEGAEIVVNDWGVLHWLHREHPALPVALGRLLVKQKRGPQILKVTERLPAPAVDHFRRCTADVPHTRDFLARMGVRRVELDNLLQGMAREGGLPGSLYYPYAYITTTRLCLLADSGNPKKNLRSIGACHKECRAYDVTLRHKDMPVPLLLKGNTQYFHNDRLPDDLAALNIDRLVFLPELP